MYKMYDLFTVVSYCRVWYTYIFSAFNAGSENVEPPLHIQNDLSKPVQFNNFFGSVTYEICDGNRL